MIPEVRFEEHKTMSRIHAELLSLISKDVKINASFAITEKSGGLWLDVRFKPAKFGTKNAIVLFRADCDGLAVAEQTGYEFSSKHQGFMHACGHDFHMAMLLGAIRAIVCDGAPVTANTDLRFVFQRAEENPITQSGGDKLVNHEGVLEGVTSAFGLHVWAPGVCGQLMSRPGNLMANSDR
jgi:amidohydrolase